MFSDFSEIRLTYRVVNQQFFNVAGLSLYFEDGHDDLDDCKYTNKSVMYSISDFFLLFFPPENVRNVRLSGVAL